MRFEVIHFGMPGFWLVRYEVIHFGMLGFRLKMLCLFCTNKALNQPQNCNFKGRGRSSGKPRRTGQAEFGNQNNKNKSNTWRYSKKVRLGNGRVLFMHLGNWVRVFRNRWSGTLLLESVVVSTMLVCWDNPAGSAILAGLTTQVVQTRATELKCEITEWTVSIIKATQNNHDYKFNDKKRRDRSWSHVTHQHTFIVPCEPVVYLY